MSKRKTISALAAISILLVGCGEKTKQAENVKSQELEAEFRRFMEDSESNKE